MKLVQILILLGLRIFTNAYKTDTWPPQSFYKHYDVDHIVKTCYDRSGVDKKELIEMEMSEDLDHLPNSREIKLYLRCFAELIESVEKTSNKVTMDKVLDFFAELTKAEQEVFVRMAAGCLKRAKLIKDLLEFTYSLTVCFKHNDNKHFYIFY